MLGAILNAGVPRVLLGIPADQSPRAENRVQSLVYPVLPLGVDPTTMFPSCPLCLSRSRPVG